MLRTLSAGCLVLFVWTAAALAQKPAPTATTFVTTSAGPMFAISRMLVEDRWNALLDRRIQESPAARSAGAAWKPSDPRWQKARAALGARATTIFAAYQRSNELPQHIATEIGKIGSSKDLDTVVAALKGPAGNAIIRQQAKRTYVVHAMSADGPKGPAIGSPEWNAQLKDLQKQFDDRAGTGVPADDPAHKTDVETFFASRDLSEVMRRVWDFGIDNATRQLNTALNLMVFDDQAAIEKDVAAAVGPAGKEPGTPAGTAPPFPLEQMATCKDSWLEWGTDDTRVGAYRDGFKAQFKQSDGGGYFVPISSATVMGMKVARVYSNTVGMARGFSVAVDAPFDTAKKAMEKSLGQPLKHCDTSDGMRTCDLEIAEKKTVMLMADATGREKTTLLGCFYFYEK